MAFLAAAAPYLKVAATVMSVASNERGASTDARRLRGMAGQERATAQRAAIEERRRAGLLESRARAVAAKSGGGVSDPSVIDLIGDISAEGEYRALTRMYEGETAAQSLELEAKERKRLARAKSISTILSGASTFAGDRVPKTFATKYAEDLPVSVKAGTAYADYANKGLGSGRYA